MKAKLLLALVYGVLAAVILVLIQLISFFYIYPSHLREADLILVLASCFGVLISVAAAYIKNCSLGYALLRWLILFIFTLLFAAVSGHLGIARFLLFVTDIQPSAAVENVTGMLMLTYMMAVFPVSVILIVVMAVLNRIFRKI